MNYLIGVGMDNDENAFNDAIAITYLGGENTEFM